MKEYLQSLANEIKNIFNHSIETTKTKNVPGRDDIGLTFSYDQVKKGKIIETCVLFIDIRDSTQISQALNSDKVKLGKIYSSFIQTMTTIADKYGYVRNIIGDRIMVVFEPDDCFTNAIACAISMFTTASRILKVYTGLEKFNVGIGIDYGEMLILKTGIQRRNNEKSEYKNLVWIGDTANFASKLTDFANKEYLSINYEIKYVSWSFTRTNTPLILGLPKPPPSLNNLVKSEKNVVVSNEDFNTKVKTKNGKWLFNGHEIIAINKVENKIKTSEILISKRVYNGLATNKYPYLDYFTEKKYPDFKGIDTAVFGGSSIYSAVNDIKL